MADIVIRIGASVREPYAESASHVPRSTLRRLRALCREETRLEIRHRLQWRGWCRDAEAEMSMVTSIPSSSMVRGCGESVSGDTLREVSPTAIPFRRIRQECSPAHGPIKTRRKARRER